MVAASLAAACSRYNTAACHFAAPPWVQAHPYRDFQSIPALAAFVGLVMSVKNSRRRSSPQGTASDCGRHADRREVHEHISVPKSFVYVYDMPSQFNSDILELPTVWHPEQYDIDQVSISCS